MKNSDYRNTKFFKEETKSAKWIKSYGGYYGMVVKNGSVGFYIKDLEVIIRDATIEDTTYDKKGEEIIYEPVAGVKLIFNKDEFSKFISREWKYVEVTAKIGIKIYNNHAGIYFTDVVLFGKDDIGD